MGSKLGGVDDDDVIADINITPFVDIVLVLLIIFMVTATTIAESSIKVELPDAATSDPTESKSFGLTLLTDGTLLLDGEQVATAELQRTLRDAKARDEDIEILIAADQAVAWGRMVWLIDLVKSEGVAKYMFNVDKTQSLPPDPASIGLGKGAVP